MENKYIDQRLEFPATKRNRVHIAKILRKYIPSNGCILEIASGSGEHGVNFQLLFPSIIWQTSDPNSVYRKSISSWIIHKDLSSKMPSPLDIDVEDDSWPLKPEFKLSLKGIVCINMIHVAPWTCTQALFEQSSVLLNKDQFLFIYGPFIMKEKSTCRSNLLFNQSLKKQNQLWGIRDLEKVNSIAISNGFKIEKVCEMPANNLSLIYTRE